MTNIQNKPIEKNECCGGPAPEETDACCVKDADAKASGKNGCGCNDQTPTGPSPDVNPGCCN